ncbi:MAG: radical SAM protein [Deltaproteobacteria bacterium]|nr:radical SAM protein [Deltaproteobacteria bacterium]
MNVLLLAPPWGEIYGRFRSVTRSLNLNPPLNLAYLAAALKDAGHNPFICDLEFEPRRIDVLKKLIHDHQPDLVGLTVTTPMMPIIVRLAAAIKSLGVPVVIGGPHVSLVRGEALEQCPQADFGVLGEAEENFARIVSALGRGESLEGLSGALLREVPDNGATLPLAPDLDALPEPYYPGIDFRNYPWSVKGKGQVPTRTIMTSRGCPFQCVFCGIENLTGRGVRFRTEAMVVDEMERAVRESPVRHFVFVDDLLTLRRKRIMALCEELAKRDLPITWEGDTRADSVDEELLSAMSRAGCTRVNFGIESGDQEILDGLRKKLKLPKVVEAFRMAKKFGLDTRGTAMIGNPGDTRETIDATIRFMGGLKNLDQPYLSIAQPYPGTELRRIALSGESNLRVVDGQLDRMRRYGGAVMYVGDISPEELVKLQRRALLRMYLRPRRIWYNLMRSSLRSGVSMAIAFAAGVLLPAPNYQKDESVIDFA